jgi:7-carboxy-7-deazaguanine synthase
MDDSLVINEIYPSLQGESSFAGWPCIFVRLTACNLRCSYCDTAYAFAEGSRMPLNQVLGEIEKLASPYTSKSSRMKLPLVELTGGEPLLQKGSLVLMRRLCQEGFTVLLETSGAHDISQVDPRVHRIMDLKCPSSGEMARNLWENIPHLKSTDEVKFVIGTEEDYQWAREQLDQHRLPSRCPVLFSWAAPLSLDQQHPSLKPVPEGQTPIDRVQLVERILQDALPVRFQLQMHKIIWSPETRGV